MKIILCTGDSHTCGQGADNIKTASKPKNPNRRYDTSGKGIGSLNLQMEPPSYVNLLRQYVVEHTDSRFSYQQAPQLCQTYGCTLENGCCVPEEPMVIENQWDLILVCAAERLEPAQVQIYLDGRLYKEETFYTPQPRYNDFSYRYIPVWCEGVKEVKIVPVSGRPHIHQIEYTAGQYAVVNVAVGSCTTKRFLENCMTYGVEDLTPSIIVAEGQTINDWINYPTAQEHYTWLRALMEAFGKTGAKLLFTTVSPIQSKQENQAGVLYADFIAQSRRLAEDLHLPIADAHAVFSCQLQGMTPEEQFEDMFVDRWHVNAKGHKIYADTIWEKLKTML